MQVKGGRRFPADVIILATGYTFEFPFLQPKSIIPVKVNHFSFKFEFSLIINFEKVTKNNMLSLKS